MSEIRNGLPPDTEIEPWWQDEARIGQKNKITRPLSANASIRLPGSGWAERGTRPSAPQDQRTKWAYVFGAICPAKGKAAGLVMPWADTPAMSLHLAEISQAVAPGAHAVVILDQAGWRMSRDLVVPGNITLMPLPPRSPELNPPLGVCKQTPAGQRVENLWQFMRDNWLSNRIFADYHDIVALCCEAWNKLVVKSAN